MVDVLDREPRRSGEHRPLPPVPPELATLMERELPTVTTEVIAQIKAEISEYNRPADSAYDQILVLGVQKLLSGFVDRIENPAASMLERDETARALGYFEAIEGRTLDTMSTAYRLAFQTAWEHTAEVAADEHLDPSVVNSVVRTMLLYMDEIYAQTHRGYEQAKAEMDQQHQEARAELLHLLLHEPPAPAAAIERQAACANWTVPDEVTIVAVEPGAHWTRAALETDVLVHRTGAEPCLVIPGHVTRERVEMLKLVLGEAVSVIGVTVPISGLADAKRWAGRVLELVETGILARRPLIRCENHLMAVLLTQDPALVEFLSTRLLRPLNGISTGQRRKLIETLTEWVISRGTANEIGERLQVHPQTVRYRIRQLDAYLGDELEDPEARFSADVTLRASRLLQRRRGAGLHGERHD